MINANMIGENLKNIRKEKNITQNAIASLLNIKRQTYSAYERGVSTPDITTIKILADYFGVTINYLLTDKNDPDTFSDINNDRHILNEFLNNNEKLRKLIINIIQLPNEDIEILQLQVEQLLSYTQKAKAYDNLFHIADEKSKSIDDVLGKNLSSREGVVSMAAYNGTITEESRKIQKAISQTNDDFETNKNDNDK